MTMQFKCDCCGTAYDVSQTGAEGCADVLNEGFPPDGFRTIYTVIEDHKADGVTESHLGEITHSCAECNIYMTVPEHLEAELEARCEAMYQPHGRLTNVSR